MKKNGDIMTGYYKRNRRCRIVVGVLLVLVGILACIMMNYGNTIYSPEKIIEVLKSSDTKGKGKRYGHWKKLETGKGLYHFL